MTKKEIDIYQYDKMEELESGSKAKYIVPEIWNKAFAEGEASRESKSTTSDVYSEHCPYCDSENITMIGDPEYNDEWYCRGCKKTFGSFKGKVNGKTL